MTNRLDMLLMNDVQEVGRVIDCLEEFGASHGIPPEQSLRFGLALDELITNIISHGLAGREDSTIRLTIEHGNGVLSAELIDDGPPFDPLQADIEALTGGIEKRRIGGLGLALVKASIDRLCYRRDGGLNRLNMELSLKAV